MNKTHKKIIGIIGLIVSSMYSISAICVLALVVVLLFGLLKVFGPFDALYAIVFLLGIIITAALAIPIIAFSLFLAEKRIPSIVLLSIACVSFLPSIDILGIQSSITESPISSFGTTWFILVKLIGLVCAILGIIYAIKFMPKNVPVYYVPNNLSDITSQYND